MNNDIYFMAGHPSKGRRTFWYCISACDSLLHAARGRRENSGENGLASERATRVALQKNRNMPLCMPDPFMHARFLYAQKYGYDFVLGIRPTTQLSEPLQNALALIQATIQYLP